MAGLWQRVQWIFWHLLTLMVFYSLMRVLFVVYNWDDFRAFEFSTLIWSFLYGWRFDLSALIWINFPFIFLWLLDWPSHRVGRVWLNRLFWFWNSLFFAANIADVELYNFTGKRLTFDFFRLSQDWQQQSSQLIFYYWRLILVLVVAAIALYQIISWRERTRKPVQAPFWQRGLLLFLLLPFLVLATRGGWQTKVLRPNHAYILPKAELGVLALNTTFSLLRTKSAKSLKARHDFARKTEVASWLRSKGGVDTPWSRPTNVVIIILESFSLEYLGLLPGQPCYAPFLKKLAENSLFFSRHFANGRRSIEAVPAILGGIPSWMEQPLIVTGFQGNEVVGMGEIFKNQGYSTHFFHGANNGTMFFDSYTRRLGFEHYYGLNEYPDSRRDSDYDGTWGILDEPYLQYFADHLDQLKDPFLAVVFTLSSHQPYPVPERYRERFPKGTLEIHQSIGYTDYALKLFFERVKEADWYDNTLFIITADHTQKLETPEFKNTLGYYRVPLLMFHPAHPLPKVNALRISEHVDILPTLIDLMDFKPKKQNLFGRSLWSTSPGRVINKTTKGYWWLDNKRYVEWDGADQWQVYAHDGQQTLSLSPAPQAVPERVTYEFKAAIQYYVNGLLENNWFRYPQSSEPRLMQGRVQSH